MLAGLSPCDDEEVKVPELNVSYKPQKIVPKSEVGFVCVCVCVCVCVSLSVSLLSGFIVVRGRVCVCP